MAELMGWLPVFTHRQFLAWMDYDNADWGRMTPDRWHMVSIATECRRNYVKDPRRVELDHLKLKFKNKAKSAMSPEQEIAVTKAVWAARTGKPL